MAKMAQQASLELPLPNTEAARPAAAQDDPLGANASADTQQAAKSPSLDQRYYADGMSWERDVVRSVKRSRSLAWLVATAMTIIALMALGSLLMLVPLKTYEPYLIAVDRSTGFLEVKRPLSEGPLQQDEAVTMFNVVRFIRTRETYDPKSLKDNFDLAQLLSTGDASRELTELYSPANPQNPVRLLGVNTVIVVTIKSVTFPNNRTALVRFATDEKSAAKIETRHFVSLVRFRYAGTPMRNEYRFENPLGFQVVEYRRDQETVPAPPPIQPQSTVPPIQTSPERG